MMYNMPYSRKAMFNYNMLSDDQLYQKFERGAWNCSTREERLALLQEVENRVAAEQRRDAMKIDVIPPENDAPGLQGYYIDGENCLFINERFVSGSSLGLNDYSAAAALDTVLHEGRHAFQHDFLRSFDNRASRQMGLEWALNTFCYMSASPSSSELQKALYVFQPLELDARRYARQRLRRINRSIELRTGKCDPQFEQAIDCSVRSERYYAGLALKELAPEIMEKIDRVAIQRFHASNPDVDMKGVSLFREMVRMIDSIDRLADDPDLIDGSFDSRRFGRAPYTMDAATRSALNGLSERNDGLDELVSRFGYRPLDKGRY